MLSKIYKTMKKTLSIFLFIFSSITYCYSQDDELQIEKPIEVTFEQLILHSKKFDKKFISVRGYVKFDKSGSEIFISKEDLENNKVKKSICFLFMIEGSTYPTVQKCDEKYVILTGFYNSGKIYNYNKKLKSKNGVISSIREIKLVDDK